MTITEPATLITDYLLAAFTAALAWRLLKQFRTTGVRSKYWWAAAFAASALASFTGGTVHGFSAVLSRSITDALWIVAMESLVVAAYCVIRAALPAMGTAVSLTIAAGYGAYGVWLASNPPFVFAIAAYACALAILAVVSLQTWTATRPHRGSSRAASRSQWWRRRSSRAASHLTSTSTTTICTTSFKRPVSGCCIWVR